MSSEASDQLLFASLAADNAAGFYADLVAYLSLALGRKMRLVDEHAWQIREQRLIQGEAHRYLALLGLRHYLERHAGRDRHMSKLNRQTPVLATAVWSRLTASLGLRIDARAGDRFHVADSLSAPLEGEILGAFTSYGLLAKVAALGDGLLAVGVQATPGGTLVWASLATFGDQRAADDQANRWLGLLLERAPGV